MFRFSILLPLLFFTSHLASSPLWISGQKKQPNRPPNIQSVTASQRVLSVCPFISSEVCGDQIIHIRVNASDPDGDKLQFNCEILAGKLSKCGPDISWDLRRSARQEHKLTVRVSDGRGGEDQSSTSVIVADCGSCDPPPPPCPVITILVPPESRSAKQFVLIVTTQGAEAYLPATFKWKVSDGKIVKGQGTAEIEVDTSVVEVESLTVEVSVGGFDPACLTTVSRQVLIKSK